MTPSTLIAVADAHALRVSDGRTFPRTGGQHTPDHLLGTCKLLGITDLYLHPSAPECAWDTWRKGEHTWIHPTPYDAWIVSTAAETRAPWREAPDGLTLLAAVIAFRDALKCDYFRSPGATGGALLRAVHTGPHALTLDLPADPPPPAREGGTEIDLVWMRPLTADEQKRRYLHSYDRNGAYLAACSSLPVGVGAASHVDAVSLTDADMHLPGYFRVHIPPAWKWLAVLYGDDVPAPPPCRVDPHGKQVWITTPTLRLLDDLGGGPCVTEAWVWPSHHRVLEPWYKRLRDARSRLDARGTPAERIALATVKACYTQTIGWMRSTKWDREDDPLYRPDWRHLIIAQARANCYRVVRACYEAGMPPFAVSSDCLYFTSDDPDPVSAAPACVKLSALLGQYKVKDAAIPLADVLPILERGVGWMGPLNTLTSALNDRRKVAAGVIAKGA